jgi:hypothetical protein
MLQRKCACGGASGLMGHCSACEKKKLLGQPLQAKLRINAPDDPFEQEADRVADEVMKTPDVSPGRRAMVATARSREFSISAPNVVPSVVIQHKSAESKKAADRSIPDQKNQKAELEFHSALHFNRGFKGFNPTSEPEEGGYGIIWWSVWNTGWQTAPEHTNRLTVYHADLCSGCRHDKDEMFRSEIPGESIVTGMEPGQSDYENGVIVGPFSAGRYDAYVELDVGNQVDEINEDNNRAFMVFNVRPSREPDSVPEATVQRKKSSRLAPVVEPDPDSPITGQNHGGRPLDAATREFFSACFGHDFGNVRVHADAEAAESARAVNALAYTVGRDVVFAAGQYAPHTRAGRQLLAHELTHVVQQSGAPRIPQEAAEQGDPAVQNVQTLRSVQIVQNVRTHAGVAAASPHVDLGHGANSGLIQRQPISEGPTVRDLPIFLDKLEFDVGQNLLEYGHHLYQAATLYPQDPDALKVALGRYALGANVLKDTYRFFGFKPDSASKLAIGTGILFKGLTLARQGELTLDFQFDIGKGVKFETNLNVAVDPKNLTDVRKGEVNFGLVRRF